jgi:ribosome-associated translation inhibitor RaiA
MILQLRDKDRRDLHDGRAEYLQAISRWVNEGGAIGPEDARDYRPLHAGHDSPATLVRTHHRGARESAEDTMQYDIRSHRMVFADALQSFARERLNAALRRFRRYVEGVTVYIRDVNGPRGGTDKRVRMIVRLRPSGSIVITEQESNVLAAIAGAARRAAHATKRQLRRRRSLRLVGT